MVTSCRSSRQQQGVLPSGLDWKPSIEGKRYPTKSNYSLPACSGCFSNGDEHYPHHTAANYRNCIFHTTSEHSVWPGHICLGTSYQIANSSFHRQESHPTRSLSYCHDSLGMCWETFPGFRLGGYSYRNRIHWHPGLWTVLWVDDTTIEVCGDTRSWLKHSTTFAGTLFCQAYMKKLPQDMRDCQSVYRQLFLLIIIP